MQWLSASIIILFVSSFFSCEKQLVTPSTDLTNNEVKFRSDDCSGPAVATLSDEGNVELALAPSDYEALWKDLAADLQALAPGGGGIGGVLHDITIWPTVMLADQGYGGVLGVSTVITEQLVSENPQMILPEADMSGLEMQPLEGGQWAAVFINEDGSISPAPAPVGWTVHRQSSNASIGFGLVVVTEENFAPVSGNLGFVVVPGDPEPGTEANVVCCGAGLIVAMEDVFYRPVAADPGGIVVISDEIFAFSSLVANGGSISDVTTDTELVFTGEGLVGLVEGTVYSQITGSGSLSVGGIVIIIDDIFAVQANRPKITFLSSSADSQMRSVSVYLPVCSDNSTLYWSL